MRKRRRTASALDASASTASAATDSSRLEPLRCGGCGGPLRIGEADVVQCQGCSATTAVPDEYKSLRDARRLSIADAAHLDALYAEVSRPPPRWERVAVFIGYTIGIITLVVMAIGAMIGAVGGAVVSDKVDGGDLGFKIFVSLGAILVGFIAVPFAGEWVIAFATSFDTDAAMSVAAAPKMHLSADLRVAGVLYLLGVVPIALAWRTSQSISGIESLQQKLAAKPAPGPNSATCRSCGAPLEVKAGAVGTRCVYCGADNLLRIPRAAANKEKDDATAIDREVQAAIASFAATKREDRMTTWTILGAGLLLPPLLCGGGWVLHKLCAAG